MIVFDVKCETGHVFEGWFGGADAFADQQARGLVTCPYCDSAKVERIPSALAIGGKASSGDSGGHDVPATQDAGDAAGDPRPSGDGPADGADAGGIDPARVKAMLTRMAKAQSEAVAKSDYVGTKFADEARAMHYGEQSARPIYGETGKAEAKALHEEGVPAMPLLFPLKPRSDA
ncbi:MAG: DUF1178 family protein [Pacificimonas sp.]